MMCRNSPPLKPFFCFLKTAAKTRVSHTLMAGHMSHKIGYYLPILWEDNSVIIPPFYPFLFQLIKLFN